MISVENHLGLVMLESLLTLSSKDKSAKEILIETVHVLEHIRDKEFNPFELDNQTELYNRLDQLIRKIEEL